MVRIAGESKCASAPRVECALQYGHKSSAAHRLACSGEALILQCGARAKLIGCHLSTGLPREGADLRGVAAFEL